MDENTMQYRAIHCNAKQYHVKYQYHVILLSITPIWPYSNVLPLSRGYIFLILVVFVLILLKRWDGKEWMGRCTGATRRQSIIPVCFTLCLFVFHIQFFHWESITPLCSTFCLFFVVFLHPFHFFHWEWAGVPAQGGNPSISPLCSKQGLQLCEKQDPAPFFFFTYLRHHLQID